MRGHDTLKKAIANLVRVGCTDEEIMGAIHPNLHVRAWVKLAAIRAKGR